MRKNNGTSSSNPHDPQNSRSWQKSSDIQIVQQAVGQFMNALYSVPWDHHIHLMDKFGDAPEKE